MQFPTQAISSQFIITTTNSPVTLLSGGLEVSRYIIHWARLEHRFSDGSVLQNDLTFLELRCNNSVIARLAIGGRPGSTEDYFLNYICDGSIKAYASSTPEVTDQIVLTYTEYPSYGLSPSLPQDYYLNTQFSLGEIIISVFTFLIFCTLIYKFLWDTIKRKKIK